MKSILKWLLILTVISGAFFGAFSLYTHFLLDYSLDNLAFAISATEQVQESNNFSPLAQKVYQTVVSDMALDEAANEKVDFQRLSLLELANRSLDEVEDRSGAERANLYLNNLVKSKVQDRPFLLRIADSFFGGLARFFKPWEGALNYIQQKLFFRNSSQSDQAEDYSGVLLLAQAEEKEKQGKMEEAVQDYQKYLQVYTDHPDRGYVAITLAQILLKLKKYDEAYDRLTKVQREMTGTEEAEIAENLARRITLLKDREKLIAKLEPALENEKDAVKKEKISYKLGLAYLSAEDLEKAQKLFQELTTSRDPQLQQKARFYLGWTYKLKSDYEASAKIFTHLLADRLITADLELGLRAQLADIYYKKGDVRESAKEYERLSAIAQRSKFASEAFKKSWTSFSELEQVNIYTHDLNDSKQAQSHLKFFTNVENSNFNIDALELEAQGSFSLNLRDLAFQALLEKRVEIAFQLFSKELNRHPEDPITNAGMATVYLLMNDAEKAREHALKAYEIHRDDYTTALMGYVEAVLESYQAAIEKYDESLGMDPSAVAARFNLACIYIYLQSYQEAIDALTALDRDIMTKPGMSFVRSKIMNNMGYAYWQMGKMEAASQNFKDALNLTPNFELAQDNLIQLATGETPQIENKVEK